ncbi:alpha/beta fold hydrolase [Steroidobacter sp. S1-65]|uniref:Alpha/beta fold hydrolase n=1 Tax=Steroidobacter gossypii TaxID=2805490 RepID=A0ABS1WQV3_9GAMM|nr:alpha/beta fold hydrolase [Steroidobacter gossypii]MBM0103347.1 alpha/beta fold hydrolase [Steroidobacter gossypii]
MRKTIMGTLAGMLLLAGVASYASSRESSSDTRYIGAYIFEDGSLFVVGPRNATELRFKKIDGESGTLWPTEATDNFEGGDGWSRREPVTNRVQFQRNAAGQLSGVIWQRTENGEKKDIKAARLRLREEWVTFQSGQLRLRGKLILPEGEGPFPAMIPVHGSEEYSAVEQYSDPYIYAAHGIAAFVYDKRGTGGSEGKFTANFHVLSDDTVAAVQYLRKRAEIDGDKINLAGYSQGGWIAPLAALKDGNIRSVFVGYGVAVPVTGEDRWGYVYAMERKGFSAGQIAEMDRIAGILSDIFDHGKNRWSDFSKALEAARSEPWFETAKHSDSLFGMIVSRETPLWVLRPYLWWKYGRMDPPYIDRLYDPVPTLAELDTPSFWVFGGKDSSAPTQWSVEELRKLQQAGRPIQFFVYPEAEHGILRFEQKEDGEREVLGYETGYFQQQIDWFRQQSGLQ